VPTGPEREYYVSRSSGLIHAHLESELESVRGAFAAGFSFGDKIIEIAEQSDVAKRFLPRRDIRMLIVDDDRDYLEFCSAALGKSFVVTTMSTPLEALAAITLNPRTFDVAVIDLNMAGLHTDESDIEAGIVVIKTVSALNDDLALIANTGYRESEWATRASEAGAHVHRVKYLSCVDPEVEVAGVIGAVERALDLLGYQVG
jgi:ActR/RegA family two-component response regulator